MATVRKREKNWYYIIPDETGRRIQRKGCPDRRATEQMAAAAELQAAKIREGLVNPKDPAYRDHEARSLADHVADFQAALLAKGGPRNTPK